MWRACKYTWQGGRGLIPTENHPQGFWLIYGRGSIEHIPHLPHIGLSLYTFSNTDFPKMPLTNYRNEMWFSSYAHSPKFLVQGDMLELATSVISVRFGARLILVWVRPMFIKVQQQEAGHQDQSGNLQMAKRRWWWLEV